MFANAFLEQRYLECIMLHDKIYNWEQMKDLIGSDARQFWGSLFFLFCVGVHSRRFSPLPQWNSIIYCTRHDTSQTVIFNLGTLFFLFLFNFFFVMICVIHITIHAREDSWFGLVNARLWCELLCSIQVGWLIQPLSVPFVVSLYFD